MLYKFFLHCGLIFCIYFTQFRADLCTLLYFTYLLLFHPLWVLFNLLYFGHSNISFYFNFFLNNFNSFIKFFAYLTAHPHQLSIHDKNSQNPIHLIYFLKASRECFEKFLFSFNFLQFFIERKSQN